MKKGKFIKSHDITFTQFKKSISPGQIVEDEKLLNAHPKYFVPIVDEPIVKEIIKPVVEEVEVEKEIVDVTKVKTKSKFETSKPKETKVKDK